MSQTLHHRPQQGYTSIHPSIDLVDNIKELAVQPATTVISGTVASRAGDAASEVSTSSNPDQWREKRSRKMHDLQLHYSCDPLRVLNSGTTYEDNLHATLSTVLPQPHGGVKEFRQKVSHTSDEAIMMQAQKAVQRAGVVTDSAVKTPTVNAAAKSTSSTSTPNTTSSSAAEASRRVLESQTGMKRALHHHRQDVLPAGIIRPPPTNSGKIREDGESVFSVTTTGMRTTVNSGGGNGGAAARPLSNTANTVSSSSSAAAGLDTARTGGVQDSSSVAGGTAEGRVGGGSRCGSYASSTNRADAIAKQIDDERASNSSIATHVREAAKQLERIEKLLGRRELPFTHN